MISSRSLTASVASATAAALLASCASSPTAHRVAELPHHPLDPLTRSEIHKAGDLLHHDSHWDESTRVVELSLREPTKADVLAWNPGASIPRTAFAIVYTRDRGETAEAVIDLDTNALRSWKVVPGVQPATIEEEFDMISEVCHADPAWQAAMRKRGFDEKTFDQILVDGWAPGHEVIEGEPAARYMVGLMYVVGDQKNAYARPIEGVMALVNMDAKKVVRVDDSGVIPIRQVVEDYEGAAVGPLRKPLKPLRISQPEGPSFTLNGNEVSWDRWKFRYSMNPREGLVLHQVSYIDDGKARPVLYRGSLAEMVVPYGDTDGQWSWRSAFDEGEYQVGALASKLQPANDAPANATLLDAVLCDQTGAPADFPGVIALYERDGGLLWRHYDYVSERTVSRRGRQLVIRYTTTIGNYDYAFSWVFGQDGVLATEVELTGILLPKSIVSPVCQYCDKLTSVGTVTPAVGLEDRYGRVVGPQLLAPNHQHFFNFRLDLDVDGVKNSVAEYNVLRESDPKLNPAGNGFYAEATVFGTEREAMRDLDLAKSRRWKIFNPERTTALGHNPGYTLVPGENAVSLQSPENIARQQAGFLEHPVQVTAERDTERNAAGAYPNQAKQSTGLALWTADNEPIADRDVVLWYTMGTTHIPHPEEWPIMPATRIGFKLVPNGFFDRNPALDVPASGE